MGEQSTDEDVQRGRRADAPPAKREIVLTVRVNDAERRRIDRAAKRLGIKPSTLLRAAALDIDEDGRIPSSVRPVVEDAPAPLVSPELNDLRVQLKGAAANINQLARIANSHRAVPLTEGEDLPSVTELLVETRALCREVLTNLGAKGHR